MSNVYSFSLQEFRAVEGVPFSYWIAPSVRRLFRQLPPFESNDRFARLGASTKDDFRFLRLWWEVPLGSIATAAAQTDHRFWVTFAKGGPSTPFYSELGNVVNWARDGYELKAFISAYRESHGWGDHWRAELHNSDFYFREGITWPLRASAFCPQALPGGCIFSVRGYAVFAPTDQILPLVGLLASNAFDYLFKSLLGRFGFPEFVVGALQKLPIPDLSAYKDELGRLAHEGWLTSRTLVAAHETAREFVPAVATERRLREELDANLTAIRSRLDALGLAAYGLSLSDVSLTVEEPSENGEKAAPEAEEDESSCRDSEQGAATTSWVIGVAFGRFDPRLATGERAIPPEPEPFDPLPSRSPAMYSAGEEPADRPDILIDDEGHADDLATRAVAIAERVNASVAENLRGWLAKDFFPLHIKMYSKSRRKAPIYWQLATPSASYSVWLYIHAFSKDTLFRVQNDYVAPKLAHEERRFESLTIELRDGATAAQRKTLAAQEAVVDELRAFLDEVKRVAPLWKPNLDDGVIINFAPLWRLVPQNKSWQKELKSTWDALCEGKYDWAHLAMHLWPERVVPKCAEDRSLAIAHGLEDVFWVGGTDGKWTARKTPTRSVDELVRERTSPAVKSALKSTLEAPAASGPTKQAKRGKANA